jgi:hypothetical protein
MNDGVRISEWASDIAACLLLFAMGWGLLVGTSVLTPCAPEMEVCGYVE